MNVVVFIGDEDPRGTLSEWERSSLRDGLWKVNVFGV